MDTVEFPTLEEGMMYLTRHDTYCKPNRRVKEVKITRGPCLYKFEVTYG
jgi:hypothetical protein